MLRRKMRPGEVSRLESGEYIRCETIGSRRVTLSIFRPDQLDPKERELADRPNQHGGHLNCRH